MIARLVAGLPIGLQLVGKPWMEADLLYVASALESVSRERVKLPTTSFDILSGKVE